MAGMDPRLQAGWTHQQAGEHQLAEQHYRSVLEDASTDPLGWCYLGMVLYDQGRLDESSEAYRAAIANQPNFPVAYYNLSNTLKAAGDRQAAREACRQALELKPDYVSALSGLASLLMDDGEVDQASELLNRALQLAPGDARALRLLRSSVFRRDLPVADSNPQAKGDSTVVSTGFNQLVHCRHGHFVVNRNDEVIGRSLIEYGEFSEAELRLFQQLVQPGNHVVEVGANIGSHTVPLAQTVGPSGRVDAFEPQRLIFQLLAANIAMNSLANVFCHPDALGSESNTIQVSELSPNQYQNFGAMEFRPQSAGVQCQQRRLDELAIERCDFLKVDVEGMELAVLSGAQEVIARNKPVIFLENDRPKNSPPLIRHLQQCGYNLFWHVSRLYREDNFRSNRSNVFGTTVSVNMLCLPVERLSKFESIWHSMTPVAGENSWWERESIAVC